MSSKRFFGVNPLDAYFINQSHDPGKLTFVCPIYTIRVHVRFPFSPKFRKFRLEIKWNGSSWFGPTGIFGTTFNLRVVHFDRSAHFGQLDQNAPFHSTKL